MSDTNFGISHYLPKMKIKLRGIEYHYHFQQKQENLPYLLLMHGFMGSGAAFNELIPSISKFCNPITLDLIGHGDSEGSEMHYRFAPKEQIADVIKLISEQLPAPLFLHGYSMGGRLALMVALQRPDLIQGLILESTTFGIKTEQERQARQALDAQRADAILGNYKQFLKEWRLLPLFKNSESNYSMLEIQENQNPLWMSNSLLGFGTGNMPYLRTKLKQLTMPVLLLAGKSDQKFVNIMNAMQHQITTSMLTLFEDTNHRVHSENPDKFVQSLQSFITHNSLP